MEKSRKVNWTKEEEYTLIEAIQTAGDFIRGTGHWSKEESTLDRYNSKNKFHSREP